MKFYSILLGTLLLAGCRSSIQTATQDIHWTYGQALPLPGPIRQTSMETNFWSNLSSVLAEGFQQQMPKAREGLVRPLGMWAVFTYPTRAGLRVVPEVLEEVYTLPAWVMGKNGLSHEGNDSNVVHVIVARQASAEATHGFARLMLLLQIESSTSTNVFPAEVTARWEEGTLRFQRPSLRGPRSR